MSDSNRDSLAPPGSEELIGTTLGSYQIKDFFAKGGMGSLYKAEHVVLQRECIIKTIIPSKEAKPEAVKRFLREIRLGAMLAHPNIIVFYDAGVHEGMCYIAMEYFPGKDLSRRYKGSPAPVEKTIYAGMQVAAALEAAHADKILHRDIKPQNVIVNEEGLAKVCDFGLAKAFGNPDNSSITTEHHLIGSPYYMAPESLKGSKAITPRTDIYGVGAVLYFSLTGRPPYEGNTVVEVLRRLGKGFPPPSAFREDVPPDLEDIILKCMAAEPEERYETAEALRDALENLDLAVEAEEDEEDQQEEGGEAAAERKKEKTTVIPLETEAGDGGSRKPAFLRIFGLRHGCKEMPLEDQDYLIGRTREADILLEHETVSRRHAYLRPVNNTFLIQDNRSRAGTMVNGRAVSRSVLAHGDSIQIACFTLEFRTGESSFSGMPKVDDTMERFLRDNFGFLPSSIRLRYRTVACQPADVFESGDTIAIGRGGILIPSDKPVSANQCIQVELIWPNEERRRFFAEVQGTLEGKDGALMCVKLHRIDPNFHQEVLRFCHCGPWIEPPVPA